MLFDIELCVCRGVLQGEEYSDAVRDFLKSMIDFACQVRRDVRVCSLVFLIEYYLTASIA